MKIAVWWCVPCKASSGIFRELASFRGVEVDVFLLSGLSEERIRLGWQFPDYGKANVHELPARIEVREAFLRGVDVSKYDIHLLNSIYRFEELNDLGDRLIEEAVPFGVMTEAPFNQYGGAGKYLKKVYTRVVLPLKTWRRARRASFVMCLSGSSRRAFDDLARQGFASNRIFPFAYFLEETSTRSADGTDVDCLKLLCIGYLTANKGQHVLIDALRRLRALTALGRVKLVVTGFGPNEKWLKKRVRACGLDESVSFVGPVSNEELIRLYSWADILVAPGIEEPWGVRINEALQAGLAVISSDGIGASELVRQSKAGRVFESGNVSALAAVISDVAGNRSLVSEWHKNALEYRSRIHPSVAARYLLAVIDLMLYGSEGVMDPPWLT